MGFHVFYCSVTVPNSIILLLKIVDLTRFAISLILFYLGLCPYPQPPVPFRDPEPHPSLAPEVTSALSIKSRLPVVEFASFVERSAGRWHGRESMCVVCLENLEARDEVRELGNCRHAFHKGCLDRWLDVGQFTCPLCRAQLLPCKTSGWLRHLWASVW